MTDTLRNLQLSGHWFRAARHGTLPQRRIFASAGQEAFFEGHVHALNVLGGVPTGTSATTTLELRLPGSRLLAAAGGARAVDRTRAEQQAVG